MIFYFIRISAKINQINKNLFDLNLTFGVYSNPDFHHQIEIMTSKTKTFLKLFLIALLFICQSSSLKIQNHQSKFNHQSSHHVSLSMLHKQNNQNNESVYDEQRYLVDLAQRQNSFKRKVVQIQNDFAGINMMLNDSSLSQQEKSIKLNEVLADERDRLISAQKELNLPYELKSCQCLSLTQDKKRELSAELQKVSSKINELQKTSVEQNKNCQPNNCTLLKQLNNEIEMMKNYQTIMEDTINSKCCQRVQYSYRDNLDVSNWHWGNTTQAQYQAMMFEKQSTTDMKMQACPSNTPWVNVSSNSCFYCPADKPLFSLGARICEKDCTQSSNNPSYVLNLTTHTCGYNTNCPQGQYFDQTIRKCSIQPTYSNESSCPPSRPFWDPLSYSCQSCPSQTPYFDSQIRKCRKCGSNQTWNEQSRGCESTSQECGQGYFYDKQMRKCVLQSNDTHSLCPPERPYWNEQTYSCDECGNDKPFYDKVAKRCRVCTDKEVFNQLTKECVPKSSDVTCSSDEVYNRETNRCQKRGTTSMCPPSTPYWDAVNFKCVQCPSQKPNYNSENLQCEPCPLNQQYSTTQQSCVPNCPVGQKWNHDNKRCVKTDQNCPLKQTFSLNLNKCIDINCNETTPYWNSTVSVCQPCPSGTVYDYVTKGCEKDSRYGNFSVCQQQKPVWNADYMRCEACPEGKTWNAQQKTCLAPSINSNHLHHFVTEKKTGINHDYEKIQGHVYGNEKFLYQHHDLTYLKK